MKNLWKASVVGLYAISAACWAAQPEISAKSIEPKLLDSTSLCVLLACSALHDRVRLNFEH